MSLADQLRKAGLVSKKQADLAQREKRKEERVAEGQQLSRREQERLEAEQRAAEQAAREHALAERRRAARLVEEEQLRRIRSQMILRAHAVRWRPGPQPFHHRSPDGRFAWRLLLPEHIATDLRTCRLAVAWVDDAHPEVVLVDRATAERVEALRPELILFRNTPPIDVDPAEQFGYG